MLMPISVIVSVIGFFPGLPSPSVNIETKIRKRTRAHMYNGHLYAPCLNPSCHIPPRKLAHNVPLELYLRVRSSDVACVWPDIALLRDGETAKAHIGLR